MSAIEDAVEEGQIEGPRRSKGGESRWTAYGVSELGRPLFVVFTLRNRVVRIISARRR